MTRPSRSGVIADRATARAICRAVSHFRRKFT